MLCARWSKPARRPSSRSRAVQDAYNDEIQEQLRGTVWNAGGCSSWYLDEKGRNTTLWPTFTFRFRRLVRRFHPADYTLGPDRSEPEQLGFPAEKVSPAAVKPSTVKEPAASA